MTRGRFDARTVGLVIATVVITGAALTWFFRSRWTDHDVSDPGVTL